MSSPPKIDFKVPLKWDPQGSDDEYNFVERNPQRVARQKLRSFFEPLFTRDNSEPLTSIAAFALKSLTDTQDQFNRDQRSFDKQTGRTQKRLSVLATRRTSKIDFCPFVFSGSHSTDSNSFSIPQQDKRIVGVISVREGGVEKEDAVSSSDSPYTLLVSGEGDRFLVRQRVVEDSPSKCRILSDPRYQNLRRRVTEGYEFPLGKKHPLHNLPEVIEKNSLRYMTRDRNRIDLGAHFHGYGGEWVKGANLAFRVRSIDGRDWVEMGFNVNHVFLEKLEEVAEEYRSLPREEILDTLQCTGLPVTEYSSRVIKTDLYPRSVGLGSKAQDDLGTLRKSTFLGLGEVRSQGSVEQLKEKVVVRMPVGNGGPDLHMLLSIVGLGRVLQPSTPDQIERLKIGQLFRAYVPKAATAFEHTQDFYILPLDDLKGRIASLAPEMAGHFSELSEMKPYENFPGRIRYSVPKLGKEAYRLGARALAASIVTESYDDALERFASMLSMGALSSETRFESGMAETRGFGSVGDFHRKSADGVFTQILAQRPGRDHVDLDASWYYTMGKIDVLFSTTLLSRTNYQHYGNFGGIRKRSNGAYRKRPNLLELMQTMATSKNRYGSGYVHEVMFKHRVPEREILGCVVKTEEEKKRLVRFLYDRGLVQTKDGGPKINGVPLDKFVHVGPILTEKQLSHVTPMEMRKELFDCVNSTQGSAYSS